MDSILEYKREPDEDFYAILGCDELSSIEQISAEYKARVLDCHPDKHLNDPNAHSRFTLLKRAKDVLTNERNQYDLWRGSGIAMTYQDWAAHKDSIGTSLHWAYKKPEPTLPGPETQTEKKLAAGSHPPTWNRDNVSDALRKFRNYQI